MVDPESSKPSLEELRRRDDDLSAQAATNIAEIRESTAHLRVENILVLKERSASELKEALDGICSETADIHSMCSFLKSQAGYLEEWSKEFDSSSMPDGFEKKWNLVLDATEQTEGSVLLGAQSEQRTRKNKGTQRRWLSTKQKHQVAMSRLEAIGEKLGFYEN